MNSDNSQSSPHRKRSKGPLDNDEEHASPSGVMGEMKATSSPSASETDTITSLDNGVKEDNVFSCAQNKAEHDAQQNIDHNEDKYYVENEVSGIKNSRQHTDHIIENNHGSSVSNEQDPPAPLNTSDSNTEAKPSQTEREDLEMEIEPNDSPSTPDVSSSTAESNNQSETSDHNSLKERPASETSDTKPGMDHQTEEENHSSPAEIRVSIRSKGYCGLRNQGATCYLNAVLQTLFMTEKFRTAVKELEKKRKKGVSFALHMLFSDLESKTGSVETNRVTNALHIGNVCEQQDAAEYYQAILSEIDENPAKIFQGKKKHSTTCIHGNHEPIEEIITFFSLAIAMDSDQYKIDVEESLNAQFDKMLMDGEDQLFCEKCNTMTDMEMKCTISEVPEVLTLHLQRFYLDYNYMTFKKNNCPVQIPLRLSLQEEGGVHHKYHLYALVNHTGSLSGGHYYADIKSFEDHQWYQFNDSTVYRIQNVNVRYINSDTACLLFFRKSDAQQEKTVMRSDKSKGPQSNRTSNSEVSCQQNDHISINIANYHGSSVSNEQDPPAPLNTSDSNTEAKPSQTEREDLEMEIEPNDSPSTPDVSPSTAESNNQSETSDNNSLKERPASETSDTKPVMDNQTEEENHPSPAEITEEKEKPEESRRPEGCVLFTVDSDNDEARAQITNLLHETPVIRRKFTPRQGLLFGFIILCLILVFALIFYLVFKLID